MNYLILIGNGFDLAHNLETSYSDFLFNYYKNCIKTAYSQDGYFEDNLIKIENLRYLGNINNLKTLDKLLDFYSTMNVQINPINDFFKNLTESYSQKRWVDIEYEYYLNLIELYKKLEKHKIRHLDWIDKQLTELNTCLFSLKEKLVDYLNSLNYSDIETIPIIKNHFKEYINENILVLNFNYTSIVNKYLPVNNPKIRIFNIHGNLSSPIDSIIFGYGDEMDSYYHKIEELNSNEFLKYFKSFGYFQSEDYRELSKFMHSQFEVIIMGHSCGISDRILLESILNHELCRNIKIFYHQEDKVKNDYFNKTQEISRHFKKENKHKMRTIIEPFINSQPLVPLFDQ